MVQWQAWWSRIVKDRLAAVVGGPLRLRVVVLLAAVLGLDSADKATIGAVAVPLKAGLHIGNTELGLLVSASTGVAALVTLPAGALTDRVNRVRLLSVAIFIWSIAMVASGLATSYLILMITRLSLGVVAAVAGPCLASLIGDLFPAAERGRIYGLILCGELVGAGLGFLVSGAVAALSWRYAFWVLAAPGLILAVALLRLLPEPARGGQSHLKVGAEAIRTADEAGAADSSRAPGSSATQSAEEDDIVEREIARQQIRPHDDRVLAQDPRDRSLWWAMKYVLSIPTNRLRILASAVGYFFFSGIRTFGVVFLRDRFDLGQAQASTLLVAIGAGAIVGVLVTGRLSDWLISHHHLSGRPAVGGTSYLVAAMFFAPGLLTGSLPVAAVVFVLAAAGVGGANPPLDAARLDLMPSGLWGRAEAVRTVLRSSLEAVAPLLFGWLSTRFGAHTSGLQQATGVSPHGKGLQRAFLVMLLPLVASSLIVLIRARKTYPGDVATAIASEQATRGVDS